MTNDDLAEKVAAVLRANGLTDDPANYDGDMHSWRCSYPNIYGPCTCLAELVGDLLPLIREREAAAWERALREAAEECERVEQVAQTPVDQAALGDLGWFQRHALRNVDGFQRHRTVVAAWLRDRAALDGADQ